MSRCPYLPLLLLAIACAACDDGPRSVDADLAGDSSVDVADTAAVDAIDTTAMTDDVDAHPQDALTDAETDAGGPPHIEARFEPDGTGFYRVPWPSDARLTPAGTPDLSDFPRVDQEPLAPYRAEIERDVFGFSTVSVIYVQLVGDVPEGLLPTSAETLAADAPLQLIDLSESGCGARVRVEAIVNRDGDRFLPANTLQVAPEIGVRLQPGTTYGFVLLRTFGAPVSLPTTRSPAFDAALADTAGTEPFAASLAPLRRCAPSAGLNLDDVAVATVFTTQDPVAQTRVLRDFVVDPTTVETRPLQDWRESEAWTAPGRARSFVAQVELPIFQQGVSPYDSAGGLAFDATGHPVIQRWEAAPFIVSIPYTDTPSTDPLPVAVFLDGTGWGPWNHLYGRWIRDALAQGFAVVSFMPQFHGGRGGFDGSPEIATFNFLNPPAGRSNFRQEVAEAAYVVRVIREQLDGLEGLPPLDTDRIVYGGHSQGAIIGALLAGVDDQYVAYALNGLSSYLSLTVVNRKDIMDFEALIKLLLQLDRQRLDRFYPVIQLMQLGVEVIDTHNYVTRWRGWPENPGGNDVFVVNGREDDTTTQRAIDHLTLVGALPPIAPPGWDFDPEAVGAAAAVALPVSGNVESLSGDARTIGTWLQDDAGHFTIYDHATPRELAVNFWVTAHEGAPRLVTAAERVCSDAADNDADGDVDCADADCAAAYPCVERRCADGLDDDANGLVDCADPECAADAVCHEKACDDGADNDSDGLSDCADPDCAAVEPCVETACADGEDADADGLTDCADPDCAAACVENCRNGKDDDQNGTTDCADPACLGHAACPERACNDGEDNDENGFVDCADRGCLDTPACPLTPETSCGNGQDDDNDGLVDCQEPTCVMEPACGTAHCADGELGSATGVPVLATQLDPATVDTVYPSRFPPGACVTFGHGEFTPDLVLHWTAPADGTFTFTTYGSTFDTVLAIYPADCANDEAQEVTCNDDEWPRITSLLTRNLAAGQELVLVISPFDTTDIAAGATDPTDVGWVYLSIY